MQTIIVTGSKNLETLFRWELRIQKGQVSMKEHAPYLQLELPMLCISDSNNQIILGI